MAVQLTEHFVAWYVNTRRSNSAFRYLFSFVAEFYLEYTEMSLGCKISAKHYVILLDFSVKMHSFIVHA